ncbi:MULTISPECIES: DUF421 domain-containing protein [Acinetobacter]|uniref:DUF421 domain-containing protein n=1 Tax=Acinetobacter chengduensis TaxID=2420890 RepID=A0ABX9TYS1_9GAMM|nr:MULTISPECIES: DUF421 domain-containing protein [Acinetobacter]RKG43174.1 DUF421 domain-containing protein [Acinetobacter sp. WCHAc060007]RLL23014.1 DUF421 domain-containing protein [Acinetobacter chengduensis]
MDFIRVLLHDTTLSFALEIVLRCIVMYVLIILVLRFSGKRGVRQLSIFEIAIILSLGSAAGDPMFYDDVPLIHAVIVFTVILLLYRFTTYLMMKSDVIETVLEGRPMYIVRNGLLIVEDIKQEKYSYDEFFAEMRQQKIEHLGQVKYALLETDGCLSVLPYSKENIKWGLPIFPDDYKQAEELIVNHHYSCMLCGQTQLLSSLDVQCSRCNCKRWAESKLDCEH